MVSLFNNLIMLFIQTEIKSSFMHQVWKLEEGKMSAIVPVYDEGLFVTDLISLLLLLTMKLDLYKQ